MLFTQVYLPRYLREGFEGSPVTSPNRQLDSRAIHLNFAISIDAVGQIGEVVQLEEGFMTVLQ
jgi:hypothetical protein